MRRDHDCHRISGHHRRHGHRAGGPSNVPAAVRGARTGTVSRWAGRRRERALVARIRMHGNLAENAPLFLILLMLTEMSGRWSGLVPIFALVFVLARFSHAIGLRMSAGVSVFRLFGVLGTVITVLGLCILLAIVLLDSNGPPLKLS
ncbi:MAG: MAPEG family protein [Alphaproteobacteria bacterium]|nr:MAPEG family protein [Alphaproteobacteria bacterium]